MNRIATLAFASVALLIATGLSSAYAGIQDFYVRNFSRAAIFYIYVSPDYSDEWEEDVLASDVLMPGDELEITLSGYGNHCWFDLRIEDERGNYQEYHDVDLCTVVYIDYP